MNWVFGFTVYQPCLAMRTRRWQPPATSGALLEQVRPFPECGVRSVGGFAMLAASHRGCANRTEYGTQVDGRKWRPPYRIVPHASSSKEVGIRLRGHCTPPATSHNEILVRGGTQVLAKLAIPMVRTFSNLGLGHAYAELNPQSEKQRKTMLAATDAPVDGRLHVVQHTEAAHKPVHAYNKKCAYIFATCSWISCASASKPPAKTAAKSCNCCSFHLPVEQPAPQFQANRGSLQPFCHASSIGSGLRLYAIVKKRAPWEFFVTCLPPSLHSELLASEAHGPCFGNVLDY